MFVTVYALIFFDRKQRVYSIYFDETQILSYPIGIYREHYEKNGLIKGWGNI